MKKEIIIYVICFICGFQTFAQRQVAPGKNINNSKAGTFEHVEGVFLAVNGINMYYEQYGEGETILMIHGNGGSVESFNNQINFFSKKYKVIVADSRGQGQSNNNKDSLSYEQMADDYYSLLEKLDIDSAYVIGSDDGAVIGLLLAIQYPEKVKKLAIYGAHLNTDSGSVAEVSMELNKVYKQMYTDSVKAGKVEYKAQLQLLNLSLHQAQIEPELLLNISAPVLVMAGDRDIVELEHTVAIYKQIPHAQLSVFPAASHNFISDTPMLFNNAVSKFFVKPFYDPELEETIKFK